MKTALLWNVVYVEIAELTCEEKSRATNSSGSLAVNPRMRRGIADCWRKIAISRNIKRRPLLR